MDFDVEEFNLCVLFFPLFSLYMYIYYTSIYVFSIGHVEQIKMECLLYFFAFHKLGAMDPFHLEKNIMGHLNEFDPGHSSVAPMVGSLLQLFAIFLS